MAQIVTAKNGQTNGIEYPRTVKSALLNDDGTPLNPLTQTNIINDLTTGGETNVLSAQQGVALNSAIGQVASDLGAHKAEIASKHITESGDNSNGLYIKFDDGTMICNGNINLTAVANTDFSATWVFPANFVGGRRAFCDIASVSATNGFAVNKLVAGGFDSGSSIISINATVTQIYACNLMAIGRWK